MEEGGIGEGCHTEYWARGGPAQETGAGVLLKIILTYVQSSQNQKHLERCAKVVRIISARSDS